MSRAEHDRTHAYRLGYIDAMNAARAWQALRDWLDGTAEEWRAMWIKDCHTCWQDGYDRAMHDVENA